MCVVFEFLDFSVILHTKSDLKVIGNWFCEPINFKNQKYNFTICEGCVGIVIWYFLFEKEAFNELLKVIGIQTLLILLKLTINCKSQFVSIISTLVPKLIAGITKNE